MSHTLEQLKALAPSFDPASFDKIPDDSVYLIPQYDLGYAGIRQGWGEMEASARSLIKASLAKKHGKPVISKAEYENLRGVASITTYNAVQAGTTIVL